jgi:V/A-type H+-transporting ATPase subunit C
MIGRRGTEGNYAYAVARVKAKKSKLLKIEDFDKMLNMSTSEISRYISEAGYNKEMTDLAGSMSGIDLVEYATNANMAKAFRSILLASQGNLKVLVQSYLEKWDMWNLKVILRGKSYGLNADLIRNDLVIAGKLDADALDKLIQLDSTEDILSTFAKMTGMNVQELLDVYKAAGNSFGHVEDYCDKYHYRRLLKSINPNDRASQNFQKYVRTEIDVRNLETILKLKVVGVYGEDVAPYIIPGGRYIDSKTAMTLASAETIEGASSDIAQLEFYEAIKEVFESEDMKVRDVVLQMKKYEISQAKKLSHEYPLSAIPVIDYMIHKEIEVRNIKTVARGIESGLPKERVKELLVI